MADEQIKDFVEELSVEFREYLHNKYPNLKPSTINTYSKDAFYINRNDIGIDFLLSLSEANEHISEEIESQLNRILKSDNDGGVVKQAQNYTEQFKKLREFVNKKHPNLSEEFKGKNINIESNESKFKQWMVVSARQEEGLEYEPSAIRTYTSVLKNKTKKLTFNEGGGVGFSNLFHYKSHDIFTLVKDKIENATNFPAVDLRGKKSFSNAIKLYEKFLSENYQRASSLGGNGKQVNSKSLYDLNIILYGPPGTGKTYDTLFYAVAIIDGKKIEELKSEKYETVAKRFAKLKEERRIEFTSFHQSFGYEEFIEGIRPVLVNNDYVASNGDIKYKIHDGIFKEFCNYAINSQKDSDSDLKSNYVFIIDEINRGNISKIFGELITLIEPSKRLGSLEETKVMLPYSKKPFGVPANVYIIGTMNTADRSIALIDTALRRRFDFIEMLPNPKLLEGINIEGIDISNMLAIMNERISALLDREHTIGHSYFLPLKDSQTFDTLASIFKNKILPLLQEYFYDDFQKIQLVLGDNQKTDEQDKFINFVRISGDFLRNTDYNIPGYYQLNPEAYKNKKAYEYLK